MGVVKRLSGRAKAGRGLTVFADDTFIVSYPRSGNTWARFLISHLIDGAQGPTDFLNIESRIPDIYQNSDAAMRKLRRPRILKSHEYFDPRYKKVIYLVRNPLNVAVSYFYYMLKVRRIGDDCPIEDFVGRFLDGTLDTFGTWREHVGSWLGARRGRDDFLLMRYEDLRRDTERNLAVIARFLDIETTRERLATAIDLASAGRMQELEDAQAHLWRPLKKARKDIPFVRSATSEGGVTRADLPQEAAAMIGERWRDLMEDLGY